MVEESDEVTGDAGDHGMDHAGHHERVIQQVLADDSRARAVEVHRGNVRGIVPSKMNHKYRCFLCVISILTIAGIVILNILNDI